jgi:hypothetical protein
MGLKSAADLLTISLGFGVSRKGFFGEVLSTVSLCFVALERQSFGRKKDARYVGIDLGALARSCRLFAVSGKAFAWFTNFQDVCCLQIAGQGPRACCRLGRSGWNRTDQDANGSWPAGSGQSLVLVSPWTWLDPWALKLLSISHDRCSVARCPSLP